MDNYISVQSSQDVIQHFGTKGMKWGRRKSKEFYTKKYIDKGYDDWGKAYDRQAELTRIGVDHRYAKAAKAYNDYVNK